MQPTRQLHDLGQRLWLDTITRTMLEDGTLARYIDAYSITGLTSNPTIFQKAIGESDVYDQDIAEKSHNGVNGEALFNQLALDDLRRAADLFKPAFIASSGIDGWVSMEVSPLLASDTAGSVAAAMRINRDARRDNLFVKIPGTPEGIAAIADWIYRGIPINVTLLFSAEQYVAAADAYVRGIERRLADGMSPIVASVASLFVSRWDVAANPLLPRPLRNRLGIAVAHLAYEAYRGLLASERWQRLEALGARPQRLLWASTGTKDPAASDILYVQALVAPQTINTLPEETLIAFADHGKVGPTISSDTSEARQVIADARNAGIDVDGLARQLQREGVERFAKDWRKLINSIDEKAKGGAPAKRSTPYAHAS